MESITDYTQSDHPILVFSTTKDHDHKSVHTSEIDTDLMIVKYNPVDGCYNVTELHCQNRKLIIYNKESVSLLIERLILFDPKPTKYSFYVLNSLRIEFRNNWAIYAMSYNAAANLSQTPTEFASISMKALDLITNCRFMKNDYIGLSVADKIFKVEL